MRPPKSRHSEPRNTHMASFSLERPVLVTWLSPWVASGASSGSPGAASTWGSIRSGRSVNERSLLGGSDANESASLVLAVLAVPEVVEGVDRGHHVEVVRRRGARDDPFQAAGVPRISSHGQRQRLVLLQLLGVAVALEDDEEEEQERHGDGE